MNAEHAAAAVRTLVPEFKLVDKGSSLLMKIIAIIVWPFCPRFMQDFTTTIGYTVYCPTNRDVSPRTVFHEGRHALDAKRFTSVGFGAAYLLQQVVALAALGVMLLFGLSWYCWIPTFAVLAFVPFPAYFRMLLEVRGYSTNIAWNYWKLGYMQHEDLKWYVDVLSGPSHFFTWPFRRSLYERFWKTQDKLRDRSALEDPYFKLMYDAMKANGELNVNFG